MSIGDEDAPPPRPFPTSPVSHGPALLAARHRFHLQISVLPADLGQCASMISELDMPCTDSPVSPSFSRMSEMFPSVPIYIVPPSARSSFQAHTRARTFSSPAFLHSPTESAHAPAPPPPPQRIVVTFHRYSSRAAHGSPDSRCARADPTLIRLGARPALPAARRPCPRLEALQRCWRSTARSSCPQTTLTPASRG
ncbi:hypothetical protein EDB85DRAFT_2148321 [Lactarius pseudohatsudake]|nr:hypothetical protein EDB85DRAFT_2148321 [Lactarius pseudohatsudake]